MFRTLTLMAAFAACLSAQAIAPDTFKLNFVVPVGGDVLLTNAGTTAHHDLCADIYIFDPNQEMAECCSCEVTPNGLLATTVSDLINNNTLTGDTLSIALLKVVSSATTGSKGNICPNFVTPKPEPGIHGWTYLSNSQSDLQDAGLSAAELAALTAECNAIKLVGSGKGVCQCPAALP